jgi:Ca2+-binding EF-hand superfamily protein
MTKNSCIFYVIACTGSAIEGDERIEELFRNYDSNQDGNLELLEFLKFYEVSSMTIPNVVW